MFGANNSGINQYKSVGMETSVAAANPVELIVMLYDGAIVACRSAIPYIKQDDYMNKSQYIFKAIRIIQAGLRISLNKQDGGQIAQNLDALYIYMTNLLIKANIDNNLDAVNEVIRLLSDLRSAWEAISKTDAAYVTADKVAAMGKMEYLEKV